MINNWLRKTRDVHNCGDGDLTRTVYGYVPVEVVNELIEKHGGIVE